MRLISRILSATALTAVAFSAQAADLPSRAAPVVPMIVPVYNWTGFYVGLNAGAAWGETGDIAVTGPLGGSGIVRGSSNGAFIGGAQLGYNFQTGAFVWGLETDIQYVGRSGNASWGPYVWWNGLGNDDGGYFGTVRGRLGWAIDRTLIYVTGGLAYGGLNSNPLTGNATSNVGWTLGGGLEYAFTQNWTAKIEGLYVQLDEGSRTRTFVNTVPLPGAPVGTYTATSSGNGNAGIVRIGVNYKF